MMKCGNCHTCGTALRIVLDGEEWCPECKAYRRYFSHGWKPKVAERSPCPDYNEPLTPPWIRQDGQATYSVVTPGGVQELRNVR